MKNENDKKSNQNNIEYPQFLEYRNRLDDMGFSHSRSYDKHLITMASGAFGLSLIFIKDYAIYSSLFYLLAISWVCLALAIPGCVNKNETNIVIF